MFHELDEGARLDDDLSLVLGLESQGLDEDPFVRLGGLRWDFQGWDDERAQLVLLLLWALISSGSGNEGVRSQLP